MGRHARSLLLLALVLAPAFSARAIDAFEQNKRLGRGVNVLGYDPLWRDRAKARFQPEHFRLIREAGFNHVRIPLHPFRDVKDAPDGKLSGAYLQAVDWAIDQALANGLLVVLDFHQFQEMAKDPEALKPRFLSFWSQVAPHCKERPDAVLFELMNEPNGKLTPDLWNQYLAEALAVVRQSNPTRTVIVGPAFWNGIGHLKELKLPEDDRNVIVTVHYYAPMSFTHQGAAFVNQADKVGVPWDGTPEERKKLAADLDVARSWAEANRRPIYLGEFGAYDKAEMSARARWTDAVARSAEERGFSWAYWQFTGDFVLFDMKHNQWVRQILDALIPKSGATERQEKPQ